MFLILLFWLLMLKFFSSLKIFLVWLFSDSVWVEILVRLCFNFFVVVCNWSILVFIFVLCFVLFFIIVCIVFIDFWVFVESILECEIVFLFFFNFIFMLLLELSIVFIVVIVVWLFVFIFCSKFLIFEVVLVVFLVSFCILLVMMVKLCFWFFVFVVLIVVLSVSIFVWLVNWLMVFVIVFIFLVLFFNVVSVLDDVFMFLISCCCWFNIFFNDVLLNCVFLLDLFIENVVFLVSLFNWVEEIFNCWSLLFILLMFVICLLNVFDNCFKKKEIEVLLIVMLFVVWLIFVVLLLCVLFL